MKALLPVRLDVVNDTLPPMFEPTLAEARVPVTVVPRVPLWPETIPPRLASEDERERAEVPS